MSIRIEFYGIVRQRVGVPCCELEVTGGCTCLQEVLSRLEKQYPVLAGECLDRGRLLPGYIANLDCREFVTDPHAPVSPGQAILILSADSGG